VHALASPGTVSGGYALGRGGAPISDCRVEKECAHASGDRRDPRAYEAAKRSERFSNNIAILARSISLLLHQSADRCC
jgi:hypothetical protein